MPISRSALAARKQAEASKAPAPKYPPIPEHFPFITPTEIAFAAQETIPAKDVVLARLPRQDWALGLVRTIRAICDTVRENISIRAHPEPIVTKLLPKGREIKSATTYEVHVAGITSGLDMARLIHAARELSEQIVLVPQPTPAELAARPKPAPKLQPKTQEPAKPAPKETKPPAEPAPKEPALEAKIATTIPQAFANLKAAFAEKTVRGATITFKDDPKDPTIRIAGLKRPVSLAHGLLCDELPANLELVMLDEGEAEQSPKGTIWVELGLDETEDPGGEPEDPAGPDPADAADPADDPTVEEKGPLARADEATLQSEYRAGKRPRYQPKQNQVARKWGCFDLETLEFVRGKNAATEAKATELCELLNLPAQASPGEAKSAEAPTSAPAPKGEKPKGAVGGFSPEDTPKASKPEAPLPLTEEEMKAKYVIRRNGQSQEWQVWDQERNAWLPDTGSKNREEARNLARILNQPAKSAPVQASKPEAPAASKPATSTPSKPAPTPPPAKIGPAPIRKADVKIGGRYKANISGKLTTVRIDSVHRTSGWLATNEASGRQVHIKSAQKLRRDDLATQKGTKN